MSVWTGTAGIKPIRQLLNRERMQPIEQSQPIIPSGSRMMRELPVGGERVALGSTFSTLLDCEEGQGKSQSSR